MEKPSRRRRPLLPTIRLTRFIFPHPHPVRLRMGERGRQIRRSAPIRSRVTRRRTCQTLNSWSKVEAASMSDKRAIRSDADPIQGASSGSGKVTHRDSSSRPPLDLLNIHDEFKSLEVDRLLPCDLKSNSTDLQFQQYDVYLHWFYNTYRDPAPVTSLVDMASKCMEKEISMTSLWVASHACCSTIPDDTLLGERIGSYMEMVIEEKGEIEYPFGILAAECIIMETELISEWLRHGRQLFNDDEYALCHEIRTVGAELFLSRRKWSFHIAAALLGIIKEAEWLIDNLKRKSNESISTSMKIRQFALDFVWEKYAELDEPHENEISESAHENEEISESEGESETTSDSDVSESQDNYLGDCYDEDYMKLYR